MAHQGRPDIPVTGLQGKLVATSLGKSSELTSYTNARDLFGNETNPYWLTISGRAYIYRQ